MSARRVLAKETHLSDDALMIPHYFDWAATAPIAERALDAYVDCARSYRGNPSSLHADGRAAAKFLSLMREKTASLLAVDPRRIIYTGGATESNAMVLNSLLWKRTPGRVIMSSIEHDSILQYRRILEHKGFEVVLMDCPGGYVDLQHLLSLLTEDTQMVCVLLVSNVLGTVQDIRSIAKVLRENQSGGRRIHLHCDAVQSIGKIKLDLSSLDVDSASFSAHKFQGPRGTGFLYLPGNTVEPLSRGGGQEMGIRGGTEHVAAIAAMNTALEETMELETERLEHGRQLRTLLEQELARYGHVSLLSPSIGSEKPVSPFICTIAIEGIPSEVFTRVLHDRGFCVSSGSACSHNTPGKANQLLVSTGISPAAAAGAVRVSFGGDTTCEDIKALSENIGEVAKTMRTITRKR